VLADYGGKDLWKGELGAWNGTSVSVNIYILNHPACCGRSSLAAGKYALYSKCLSTQSDIVVNLLQEYCVM